MLNVLLFTHIHVTFLHFITADLIRLSMTVPDIVVSHLRRGSDDKPIDPYRSSMVVCVHVVCDKQYCIEQNSLSDLEALLAVDPSQMATIQQSLRNSSSV